MKPRIIVGTCALWAVVTCAWAYSYVTKGLAAPGVIGYEAQWNVQLFFFAITRLPILVVILGVVLWIEAKFLPSASRSAATKSESEQNSGGRLEENWNAVTIVIRVVGALYGVVGAGFAALLLAFVSAHGATYSMQIQYLLIGTALSFLTMYGFLKRRRWGRLLAIGFNSLYLLVFFLPPPHRYPTVTEVLFTVGAALIIAFCLFGRVVRAMKR